MRPTSLSFASAISTTQRPWGTRSPSPPEVDRDPAARMAMAWSALLADIGMLMPCWLDLAQPSLQVSYRLHRGQPSIHGTLGLLDTCDASLRLLLGKWHRLCVLTTGVGLGIDDADARPLARLRPDEAVAPALRQLVQAHHCPGGLPRVLGPRPPRPGIGSIDDHGLTALQHDHQDPDQRLSFVDLAELSGRLPLHPTRLRGPVRSGPRLAIAIDPTLVPCALEVLVDQAAPLWISTGNDGAVLTRRTTLYGHHRDGGRMLLRGDNDRLDLDPAAIDSAWVVGDPDSDGPGRELRLYTAEGRALAIFRHAMDEPASGTRQSARPAREPALWRQLMNALVS